MEGVKDASNLEDIKDLEDIKRLVDIFYDKVREDALLAPIFNGIIKDRWPSHMNTMYTFWQTVLLGDHTYFGSPFVPHAKLPVDHIHFQTWLKLFNETVDELFSGTIATEAKWRADKMAIMFETKIKHYQNTEFRNLL
ncbi:hemoglobin [Albibacterium bauzanense]|uniref:Hemoglobin n=2 Tax=Albibacterium bauzanense TaxID=653929 RepID=A0A4R1LWW5_9SPHI|nr:hemoglobin [Albibacterium bauzanense]